jgi:4-amino-4-deoxy-L-arabinose transferase-like glycosyltransferase
MPASHRWGVLELGLLSLIVAVAAGTRFWYVGVCAAGATTAGPLQVQDARPDQLSALVENLSQNRGYALSTEEGTEPRKQAHPAPLYPWLLSLVRRLASDPAATERWARWGQCGLGAAAVGLLYLFAQCAFQSTLVAGLAGLLAAFYPFWIINTAEINDGTLACFLLAACLYLGAAARHSRGTLTSWFFGLALAGLALTRAALLPFAVVALLWFLQHCRVLERGWMLALLAFLGFVLGLTPWLARNYQAFHEIYPITDTTIHHVWLGNRPDSTEEPASDRAKLEAVWEEMQLHPSRTIQRRIEAGLAFCFGDDWLRHGRLCRVDEGETWESAPSWLARSYRSLLAGSLLGLLLLAGLGWRWTYPWSIEAMPSSLALIWIPLPYLLGHAEALHGPRLPLDGVLLCYAAYALVWLVRWWELKD